MKRNQIFQVLAFSILVLAISVSVSVLFAQSKDAQTESINLDDIEDAIRFAFEPSITFEDEIACVLQVFCE